MSMLWTIVPIEKVFADLQKVDQPLREVSRDGITMLVREGNQGMGTIERIISPNPQDYLKPQWQPGVVVELSGSGSAVR